MRIFVFLLIILGAAAGAGWFLLENPERFKPQISGVISQVTGYNVTFGGSLSWRYWPPIALDLENISLENPSSATGEKGPVARFDRVQIDVDLIPLLSGQRALNIDTITLSGGDVTLVINEAGESNWASAATTATNTNPAPDTDLQQLIPSINAITLSDVTLGYTQQGVGNEPDTHYELAIASLRTSALAEAQPFAATLAATLTEEASGLTLQTSVTGDFVVSDGGGRISFNNMIVSVNTQLEDQTYPTLTMAADGHWRAQEQVVVFNRNEMQISSLAISTTGLMNLAGTEPRFDGVLTLQSADPGALKQDLDIDLPFTYLQLTADVFADSQTLTFKTLNGQFDDSSFTGQANIAMTPMSVRADLRIDRMDLDLYTSAAPAASATSTSAISNTTTAPGTDTSIIPVDLLRQTALDLILRVDEMHYDGNVVNSSKIDIDNNGQLLALIANTQVYGGKAVLSMDTALGSPVVSLVNLSLDKLDVTQLVETPGVTGRITATSNLQFEGSQLSDLTDSLAGETVFTIKEGTADITPLKSLAQTIDAVRGKTSSVSEWPDNMPFDTMLGQHVFNGGITRGQVLTAQFENLYITALGGFNLEASTLDYDITAMFEHTESGKYRVSKQLAGIRWPMRCQGDISEPLAALCFSQPGAIRTMLTEVAKQDLGRRTQEKTTELVDELQEKVPEEYRDLTNELFKNLFRQ